MTVTGPRGDRWRPSSGSRRPPTAAWRSSRWPRRPGLALLAPSRRDPRVTTTRGTGELILAALDHGPRRLIVGSGRKRHERRGGGDGAGLGVRLLDGRGASSERAGAAWPVWLASTRPDRPAAAGLTCVAATDVDNPLASGRPGAARSTRRRRGRRADDVVVLDRALAHLAAVVERDLGVDLRESPAPGAAGGLGFGLMAFLGAHVRPGVDVVAEALGLPARDGRRRSRDHGGGKAGRAVVPRQGPAGILRLGRELSVPVAIVCGEVEPGLRAGRCAGGIPGGAVRREERARRRAPVAGAAGGRSSPIEPTSSSDGEGKGQR